MGRTIEISDETYEKIKDQLLTEEKCDVSKLEDLFGKAFFFRTVTYHLIGKVESNPFGKFLKLVNTIWVADSGRFMQCIKNGTISEYEEVGAAFVNLDSVTDFFPWVHKIPRGQK